MQTGQVSARAWLTLSFVHASVTERNGADETCPVLGRLILTYFFQNSHQNLFLTTCLLVDLRSFACSRITASFSGTVRLNTVFAFIFKSSGISLSISSNAFSSDRVFCCTKAFASVSTDAQWVCMVSFTYWHIFCSKTMADIVFPFGAPGDQPLAGDWVAMA
jgi:hypothetical protein